MGYTSINDVATIERCILRSQYILMAKSVQHNRKEQDYFLNRMPTNTLLSKDCLNEFDKELFILIDGWKRDVANFLRPLLHREKIEILDKFWFTLPEMEKGCVQLSTRDMAKYGIEDRVLILSEVNIGKEKILPGTIITWVKYTEIADQIPSALKGKPFIVHYMLRKSKETWKKETSE